MNYFDSLNQGISATNSWNKKLAHGAGYDNVSILEELKLDPIQEDEPLSVEIKKDEKKHRVRFRPTGAERRQRNKALSDYDFKTEIMEQILVPPAPHPLAVSPRKPTNETFVTSHHQQRHRTTDVITCPEDFDRMVQTSTKRRRNRNQAFTADDFKELILPNLETAKALVFI